MTANKKLEQQVEFLHNIARLLEFSDGNEYALVYDPAKLDIGCEYGRAMYSSGLAMAFKMFRRTPSGRLDYFGLEKDHNLLASYWKSLDTRCEWEDRIYSMPWRSLAE